MFIYSTSLGVHTSHPNYCGSHKGRDVIEREGRLRGGGDPGDGHDNVGGKSPGARQSGARGCGVDTALGRQQLTARFRGNE